MDLLSIAAGAFGVALVYFIYLAATKGLPVAWAWLKAWWNAGKAAATALQAGIDAAHERITALEKKVETLGAAVRLSAAPAAAAAPAPAAGNSWIGGAGNAPAAAPQAGVQA